MSGEFGIEAVVVAAYVGCLVILLIFSLGQWHLTRLLRSGRTPMETDALPAPAPTVTVQLPVYNERYVAARIVAAVAALDYPRDRFDVQVLDDSTDVTGEITERLVDELSADGLRIQWIHRECRIGFKAGALAEGLARSDAEFVAVFDADFVPGTDFLASTVPHFAHPDVAAVQARWGHLNEDQSALTRVQAFLLDLHFRLEQPARYRAGLFLNFNGTAGVWRRAAIDDAGGWTARTVTEDIDLSYRAQLRGWRLVYLHTYACPAELPIEMSGVRGQQHRWQKGGAQNARLHLVPVVRSSLPAAVRWHACQHLLAGSMYLVILAMLLLTVPLAALKNTEITTQYADYGIPFVTATLALVATFWAARAPVGARGRGRFAVDMVAFMTLTMGLATANALAVLAGWTRRGGTFVRTPKRGTKPDAGDVYTRRSVDPRIAADLLVLTALVAGVLIGWRRDEYAFVPVQLLAVSGITWVLALSLWQPLRTHARPLPDNSAVLSTITK